MYCISSKKMTANDEPHYSLEAKKAVMVHNPLYSDVSGFSLLCCYISSVVSPSIDGGL